MSIQYDYNMYTVHVVRRTLYVVYDCIYYMTYTVCTMYNVHCTLYTLYSRPVRTKQIVRNFINLHICDNYVCYDK